MIEMRRSTRSDTLRRRSRPQVACEKLASVQGKPSIELTFA